MQTSSPVDGDVADLKVRQVQRKKKAKVIVHLILRLGPDVAVTSEPADEFVRHLVVELRRTLQRGSRVP